MSYTVLNNPGELPAAEAAVLCVEITMGISETEGNLRLAAAGGEKLRAAMRPIRFLPAGSACAVESCGLPYKGLILAAPPRWLTGKMNELLVLHRCYESIFAAAAELGAETVALPFLSTWYYRFPQEEAVHVALREAEKTDVKAIFTADTPALFALSKQDYRKPQIVSYIGYYRDHALFELDNGLYARVDLRPENVEADVIPYFEACYRVGNNPLQEPLPEEEIARLRAIYEDYDWC